MDGINEIVLESQVAILSGGVDKNGTPLLTFPTDVSDLVDIYSLVDILRFLQLCVRIAGGRVTVVADLQREWTSEAITKLSTLLDELQLCVRIAGGRVTVVADLQHEWTSEAITKLTTLLDELQTSIHRCITTVYLIKPKVRKKGKLLHRELSRKYGPGRMVPYYTVKRLDNHEELYNYVDRHQLTTDYGGTMQYDHLVWMQFHKTFYPVIKETGKVLSNLPVVKDEVRILFESFKETTRTQNDSHVKEIMAQYEALLSKGKIRETLERCQQSLRDLESPDRSSGYQDIHARFLVQTTNDIRAVYSNINDAINNMDSQLSTYTKNEDLFSRISQCRENANEVIDSIVLLNEEIKSLPIIGNSLDGAQQYRQQFIEEILNPSKDIVSCSTVILKQLDTGKDTTPKSYAAAFEIAKQLTEALQPFTQTVNNLNEIYTRTHLFFVLIEKVKRWKHTACNFIIRNTNIVDNQDQNKNNDNNTHINATCDIKVPSKDNTIDKNESMRNTPKPAYPFPDGWSSSLKKFFVKHPAPKRRHLRILTKNVPDGVEKCHRTEANNVVERTIFILAFLDKDFYKAEDLVLIKKWNHSTCRSQQPSYTIDQDGKVSTV